MTKHSDFTRSVEEPYIYYNFEKNESLCCALYGYATHWHKALENHSTHKDQAFQMKDPGVAGKFFGMNLTISSTGIEANMEEYINNLLLEYGMADCKPIKPY